jgi:hypothetical protein
MGMEKLKWDAKVRNRAAKLKALQLPCEREDVLAALMKEGIEAGQYPHTAMARQRSLVEASLMIIMVRLLVCRRARGAVPFPCDRAGEGLRPLHGRAGARETPGQRRRQPIQVRPHMLPAPVCDKVLSYVGLCDVGRGRASCSMLMWRRAWLSPSRP